MFLKLSNISISDILEYWMLLNSCILQLKTNWKMQKHACITALFLHCDPEYYFVFILMFLELRYIIIYNLHFWDGDENVSLKYLLHEKWFCLTCAPLRCFVNFSKSSMPQWIWVLYHTAYLKWCLFQM